MDPSYAYMSPDTNRLGRELKKDNMESLPQLIEECLSDPRYAESRHQVLEETWAYPGEGAERCVDWLLNKAQELEGKEEIK